MITITVLEIEIDGQKQEVRPFDLEKALNGAKVVTRSGKEVTELHNFTTIEGVFTLLGVVGGYLHDWKINGDHESLGTSPNDLFIVSKVIRKYQNVYYNSSTNDMFVGILLYDSNEQAKQNIDIWNQHTYIKTIEITHEIY